MKSEDWVASKSQNKAALFEWRFSNWVEKVHVYIDSNTNVNLSAIVHLEKM
jgi:hypothetical protein